MAIFVYCDKCEKPTKYWIDSVCKKCRPEPPTTENLIILKENVKNLKKRKRKTPMVELDKFLLVSSDEEDN